MVRFLFICVVLSIRSFSAMAQPPLSFYLGINNKSDFLYESAFLDPLDGGRQFFMSLPCKDQVHLYLLDSNFTEVDTFTKNKESSTDPADTATTGSTAAEADMFFKKSFEPAGSIRAGTGQLLCAFLRNDDIFFNSVDFTSHAVALKEHWKSSKKEKLLFCFSYLNHFFWLTVNRNSITTLKVYRYNESDRTDTVNVPLDSFFPSSVNPVVHYWLNETSLVQPQRITTLLQSSLRGKFFVEHNMLYIVSDQNSEYTNITAVDLFSFNVRQYNTSYVAGTDVAAENNNHNSFILDGILLQASIQKSIFSFSISKLQDTTQPRMYSFGKTDDIIINNSPVMQYGSTLDQNAVKELTKPKQFIRKVNSNGLAIMATRQEGSLQAEIGASVLNTGGGGGSVYTPGGSFATPGGLVSSPGHWTSFGGGGYKYSRTVFFYSIFDPVTFDHLPEKKPAADKVKQLDDLLETNSRHLKDPVFINNIITTGYLDTDTKKFNLVHI